MKLTSKERERKMIGREVILCASSRDFTLCILAQLVLCDPTGISLLHTLKSFLLTQHFYPYCVRESL